MYDRFKRATTYAMGEDLVVARLQAGLMPAQAAEMVGLGLAAYRRQERGQSRVSLAVYRLLKVLAGALPWDAWADWTAVDGRLYSPHDDRHGYEAVDLYRAHWLAQHAGLWRALESGLVTPIEERRQHGNDETGGGVRANRGGVHHPVGISRSRG